MPLSRKALNMSHTSSNSAVWEDNADAEVGSIPERTQQRCSRTGSSSVRFSGALPWQMPCRIDKLQVGRCVHGVEFGYRTNRTMSTIALCLLERKVYLLDQEVGRQLYYPTWEAYLVGHS